MLGQSAHLLVFLPLSLPLALALSLSHPLSLHSTGHWRTSLAGREKEGSNLQRMAGQESIGCYKV